MQSEIWTDTRQLKMFLLLLVGILIESQTETYLLATKIKQANTISPKLLHFCARLYFNMGRVGVWSTRTWTDLIVTIWISKIEYLGDIIRSRVETFESSTVFEHDILWCHNINIDQESCNIGWVKYCPFHAIKIIFLDHHCFIALWDVRTSFPRICVGWCNMFGCWLATMYESSFFVDKIILSNVFVTRRNRTSLVDLNHYNW